MEGKDAEMLGLIGLFSQAFTEFMSWTVGGVSFMSLLLVGVALNLFYSFWRKK